MPSEACVTRPLVRDWWSFAVNVMYTIMHYGYVQSDFVYRTANFNQIGKRTKYVRMVMKEINVVGDHRDFD